MNAVNIYDFVVSMNHCWIIDGVAFLHRPPPCLCMHRVILSKNCTGTKSKCSIFKFTVYNSFEMRLITCKTVIWLNIERVQYAIIPGTFTHTRGACARDHMLHNSIFGLPSRWYLMRILITQPSKHINWNDIMYILYDFSTIHWALFEGGG